jgi:hypothetical protein
MVIPFSAFENEEIPIREVWLASDSVVAFE